MQDNQVSNVILQIQGPTYYVQSYTTVYYSLYVHICLGTIRMIPDLHTNPTNVVSHVVTGPVVKICHQGHLIRSAFCDIYIAYQII